MPGIPPSDRGSYFTRKSMLDCELLSIIAPQVFHLRRALSLRVVQRRFFEKKKYYIPFEEFGFPDLLCYLLTVKGIRIARNSTNGQYQVVADEDYDLAEMQEHFLSFHEEDANVI